MHGLITFEWNGLTWFVTHLDHDLHIEPRYMYGGRYPAEYVQVPSSEDCMFCEKPSSSMFTIRAQRIGAKLEFYACSACAKIHHIVPTFALTSTKELPHG